jgi:hypothetical protein
MRQKAPLTGASSRVRDEAPQKHGHKRQKRADKECPTFGTSLAVSCVYE